MFKAFKEFLKIKLKDKKNIHIALIFVVYAIIIFGASLTVDFPYSLIVIVVALAIMITVIVPFISWYEVYYKDENK